MALAIDAASGLLVLLGVGVAAGLASALMGIGGGLVMVPVLHYLFGLPWPDATALSLLAIVIQAPTGLWRHHARGAVAWRTSPALVAGGFVGVLIGAWTQSAVPLVALRLLFAGVLAYAAWRMVRPVTPRQGDLHWLPVLAVGLAAGIAAKWLGIGGGMITVPVLVLAGVAVHRAVGTSLVPVWTNAVVATAIHARAGLAWAPGAVLGAGAVGGALLGVRLAHSLSATRLRRVLAVILGATALAIAATARSAAP